MPYSPQTWTNGVSKLNATRMGVIETGIQTAQAAAEAAIAKSLVDAKGDLIVGTAADTAARLAVGTNNFALVADSAQTGGVKWAQITNAMIDAAAAIGISKLAGYPADSTKFLRGDGSWAAAAAAGATTQIGDIDLTSTQTFSSIPGTYNSLRIIVYGRLTGAVTAGDAQVRFNADTGANYDFGNIQGSNSAASSSQATAQTQIKLAVLPGSSATASRMGGGEAVIPGYAQTTFHKIVSSHSFSPSASAAASIFNEVYGGVWLNTAAITSVTLVASSGAFATGSRAQLYGVL